MTDIARTGRDAPEPDTRNESEQEEEDVPGHPGLVARCMFDVLSEFISPEHLSLGGGAVLAARWRHRVSLDVEMFREPGAYASLGRPGLERLGAAIIIAISTIGYRHQVPVREQECQIPSSRASTPA